MAKFANTKGLSKQEKYMVQGMLLEDNKPEEKPVQMQEVPVQHPTQHIINKTGKGNRGVAVMTPSASERSDGKSHNRGIHNAKNSSYTHKIR